MSSGTDWHTAQVAIGLDIGRAEIEAFAGVPTSAHFTLHSTGDVTAMYPFNRAKPKSDEPATRLADMSDVARAKREAKDYTDDMFARTIKRVQALEDERKPVVASLYDYRALASATAVAQQERDALREENASLRGERDFLRIANVQQAKTIGEMQVAAKNRDAFIEVLEKTNLDLQRERDNAREGREKAVARCVELEEKLKGAREGWEKAVSQAIELQDANRHLYALLGASR